jgi:tetratricopeptide (TPR) repeat protein
MARLDAVFARDQFEERPLIWKALLLHQAGREEEAEKVARQAIAIDPSDGEQGKGDRMRVYGVLADIRAARGDQKEADFLRGAVRAIRLSEQADDYQAAGLLSRGVKMYQDSLKHFADAYCIQSRLAVQLTALGLHETAAQHYEKAFELMPDSFGRVESHCFGCESTFSGPQAQTVAERVFTTLAAKNPDKPQIHYLLGVPAPTTGAWPGRVCPTSAALCNWIKTISTPGSTWNNWDRNTVSPLPRAMTLSSTSCGLTHWDVMLPPISERSAICVGFGLRLKRRPGIS